MMVKKITMPATSASPAPPAPPAPRINHPPTPPHRTHLQKLLLIGIRQIHLHQNQFLQSAFNRNQQTIGTSKNSQPSSSWHWSVLKKMSNTQLKLSSNTKAKMRDFYLSKPDWKELSKHSKNMLIVGAPMHRVESVLRTTCRCWNRCHNKSW